MADPLYSLPPPVVAAFQRGNVVEAIKLLRQHRPQLGLAEAKALVDALQKQGQARVNVKTQVTTSVHHDSKPHAPPHAPPDPATMNPHVTPGEVPRGGNAAAGIAIIVGIIVVLIAATYFSR